MTPVCGWWWEMWADASQFVIPTKVGTHGYGAVRDSAHHQPPAPMGPGFRRDDEEGDPYPTPITLICRP